MHPFPCPSRKSWLCAPWSSLLQLLANALWAGIPVGSAENYSKIHSNWQKSIQIFNMYIMRVLYPHTYRKWAQLTLPECKRATKNTHTIINRTEPRLKTPNAKKVDPFQAIFEKGRNYFAVRPAGVLLCPASQHLCAFSGPRAAKMFPKVVTYPKCALFRVTRG